MQPMLLSSTFKEITKLHGIPILSLLTEIGSFQVFFGNWQPNFNLVVHLISYNWGGQNEAINRSFGAITRSFVEKNVRYWRACWLLQFFYKSNHGLFSFWGYLWFEFHWPHGFFLSPTHVHNHLKESWWTSWNPQEWASEKNQDSRANINV